ncbi:DNA polymerase beta domain protein region [Candidatus Vecturithrix granuli]|uniref:DNA polymerase beta domain protein region n=1 Tax=Vecturithrix granuli TaxID=1499967 RepID=A0A081BZ30_VECG1|nr:DNA polymerase beta domain protein region [Candidatus Vecturithrix granuli]
MVEQGELMKTHSKSRMNRRDKRILGQFATLVRQHFPEARIWAFGSRVNGSATEESDLDICVVVHAKDETIKRHIRDVSWQVGFDHDRLISTIIYSDEEFERGPCLFSPIVKTILREGVAA